MIFICEYLQFRKLRIKLESKLYKREGKRGQKVFLNGMEVTFQFLISILGIIMLGLCRNCFMDLSWMYQSTYRV